jgi:hypothetical protein
MLLDQKKEGKIILEEIQRRKKGSMERNRHLK